MTSKLRSRFNKSQKASTLNRRSFSARILTASTLCAMSVLGAGVAPASALPSTTSWTNSGLQNIVVETGNISVSADGCGDRGDSVCDISVLKPAGATVRKAYFVIASGFNYFDTPTQVKLAGTTVTFTHKAQETRNPPRMGSTFNFANHLADVTDLVKPIVDAGGVGEQNLSVDYSLSNNVDMNRFSGAALTIIYDDPGAPLGSVLYNFGTTSSAGESFTMSFPSAVKANLTDAWLSAGIGWSVSDGTQVTKISISSNGRPNVVLSGSAGGADDGNNITVGGIADNISNPASTSTTAVDDELYSLQPLLEDGDTYLTMSTQNLSNDDNLFQVIMYLPSLTVSGVTVGVAIGEGVAAPAPAGSIQTPTTTPSVATTTTPSVATTTTPSVATTATVLATTGTSATQQLWLTVWLILTGAVLLGFARSKNSRVPKHLER